MSLQKTFDMMVKSSLLLAVTLLCYKVFFGQTPFPYDKTWKRVDSLIEKKGLPKSALEEVKKIYAAAKREKQEGQWVKAVIYLTQLQTVSDEDVQKSRLYLEEEIRNAPPRVAVVLKSLEAEQLNNYLQQERYRLSNRTEIKDDSSDDMSGWTAGRLNKKIRSLYIGSLENESLLKQTGLAAFDVVLLKGNARRLRPTLYDLLAFRALDYFQQNDPQQPLTADAHLMEDPAVFLPSPAFVSHSFRGADSVSNHLTALRIFQGLLRFHAQDAKPDAGIDADINRIAFVYRYAIIPEKDSLYLSALQNITNHYPSLPASAQAWYLQAAFFSQRASSFDPVSDTAHQYDYVKTKAICDQVQAQQDSSEGKTDCEVLLRNIIRKSYTLEMEKVNLPDAPFRALVSYKNVNHLYARIIRIDDATRESLNENNWDPATWKRLGHLPALKSFDQALPDTKDYQQHRVEIKADALPAGQYALFTSSDPSFSEQGVLAVNYFFCSSIAFMTHGRDYFVADRNTGEPLAGVKVQSLIRSYNSKQQKYVFRKKDAYLTDAHGYFRLAMDKENRYEELKLEFYYGKDYLSNSNERIYAYNNSDEYAKLSADKSAFEKKFLKTILFTDRSIYRPGQTVYFEGLLVTKDFNTKRYKVVDQVKSKLYLFDVNEQAIDSLVLQSDEYGSYHGSFRLPDNLLNGEFSIKDSLTDDNRNFSVEEYKRPKFYIAYNPVKGSYSIGDAIHLSGSAMGYAGNAVDGSKVRYRVFRETRFPYPWFFRRIPANAEQEISHGETVTDVNGKFTIDFKALADRTIKKESKPVFIYRITTDIIDLNGETRSATTSVAASYQSFQIVSPLPQESRMDKDSLYQIAVTTQNASGEFQPQLLTVSLYKLKAPDHLIRKRYWDQPDQFVISKEDYLSAFPYDEYKDETNKAIWDRSGTVLMKTDSTRANGLLVLDSKKVARFTAGWYMVEFSAKDKDGEMITDKKYVELVDGREKKPAFSTYNLVLAEDHTSEPGKEVTIKTGTTALDVNVIRAREGLEDSQTVYSFYKLDNEIKSTPLTVSESDRGGFAVNDVFIKNNRWYSSRHIIHVPWTNKELQVSYETWRDKILPGSAEQWKIKISGDKKNKATAEVLTAMYDASLDQFKRHNWSVPDLYPIYTDGNAWNGISNFNDQGSTVRAIPENWKEGFYKRYDQLITSGPGNFAGNGYRRVFDIALSSAPMAKREDEQNKVRSSDLNEVLIGRTPGLVAKFTPPKINQDEEAAQDKEPPGSETNAVQIRKNFNETAFFFPDLKTDADGNLEISFTMPEALTQWKWMILAHTKDLALGYSEKTVVTQKELMLQPNMPRFFREGDSMSLPVKISNLSAGVITGTVSLDWMDATDNSNQDKALQNKTASQPFTVAAGQSTVLSFSTVIPTNFQQPVLYRLIAKSNTGTKASDGEEGMIPVLSNRMLVTETLPLNMTGKESKQFSWEKLLQSKVSATLQNQSLTVEYTSNPAWCAVQSLPYLMEFPYECAEQTFNRFYANAIASQMVNSAPGIQAIFEKWKNTDSAAFLSNLQKNEELKTVLLRETPWVLDAQDENKQKKNLALLFDLVRMSRELKSAVNKLQQMQSDGGGFPWFKGGRDDRYITQYIISGIGHLKKLKAIPSNEQSALDQISRAGIAYLDKELKSEYEHRNKRAAASDISSTQIQYLYMRSFFSEIGLPGSVFPAMNYYRKQAVQYWPKQNMYLRGMIALFLHRTGDRKTAKDIIASLKENATQSEDMGMYWKTIKPGYYWQEAPVEAQSLLIEAFGEISPDLQLTDQMKYWLLQQKRTQHWNSTKATADACYAILLSGSNWLAANQTASIRLGDYTVNSSEEKTEAGTGYMKKVIPGKDVRSSMGNIQVSVEHKANTTPAPSWGALYWQYFENLDQISSAQSPLSISKDLFIEKNTDRGPMLEKVSAANSLKPGDKLKMRIIIKSDRDMEYVHLKDMRAACLEPVNVLSGYRWQGSLGYYETTRDESTSFFIDYLPKGEHVFEYPLFVTTAGTYSNGISTLECMYAPEFAAHAEGQRIRVTEK